MSDIPQLDGDAAQAASYRGGHMQIVASAGAGKTEVVAQRVARLLAEGVEPRAIVAFTFTERAASELKTRIDQRAVVLCGEQILDRIGSMYVGTIHAYCLLLLQQHVPRYEVYDVLDDHRLIAFLSREAYRLGVADLDTRLYQAISRFASATQVVENELIAPDALPQPLRGVYRNYYEALHASRLLTYGQFISLAVDALGDERVRAAVAGAIEHLIVDEYQDVNPAQEELIKRLVSAGGHVCVVGDDQQCIFQWRGSTVRNIVTFATRYPDVARFQIETNRRSRPSIVALANTFAESISERLEKAMQPSRPEADGEVSVWIADRRVDEAAAIAEAISTARERGYAFRDIAILCRGKASFPAILDALDAASIPVQPGGRTALFDQPEAELFGRTVCWLVDWEWRTSRYGWETEPVDSQGLIAGYVACFGLTAAREAAVLSALQAWKAQVDDDRGPANLVRDFYDLLAEVGVQDWDLGDALAANRLGTLARCSQLLADYESVSRRSRPNPDVPGEQRGALDRGRRYYEWLARYVQNWARGAYEAFEGEENLEHDAVDLLTVHKAKGLEWPIVFVPALTTRRFPGARTGEERDWLVPRRMFDASRYEGTDDDERRLFYVATTRARDHLSLSAFSRIESACAPSPYLLEILDGTAPADTPCAPPAPEPTSTDDLLALEVSFSELSSYSECGLAFRLRHELGFQPNLVPEIGYGRAVHHILRQVAEAVRSTGTTPGRSELDELFDDHFYLPAANRPAHRQLKAQARRLVDTYIETWDDDLHRIWAVERPFSLHFGDATVSGRADVIIETAEAGEHLSIVDYKTAADGHDKHAFQLRIYTEAGRREGLGVDRAFVHDLRAGVRHAIGVTDVDTRDARLNARDLLDRLRARDFRAQPEPAVCERCDVRRLCRYRAEN